MPEPDAPAPTGSAEPADGVHAVAEASASAVPAVRRPTIEKVKADEEIFIPEGHERGEVMTLGQKVVYELTWLVSVGIARSYFRATVKGRHNVPETGAFIISPVHRSNLDSPAIALVTRRRMRYMGKESLWKRRWSAWYFTAAGGFPVERATADRAALAACLDVLERGEPLVLFPEGTRQSGPVVTEMFDGPAWLASRAQVPILPVGIGGSEKMMGKGSRFPRPSKLAVVVGAPIEPPPPGPSGRVRRRAVRETTVRLRDELQQLFDEAQALAGTPNPPA